MKLNLVSRISPKGPFPVIAFHCSGAGAGQWRPLGEALGDRFDLHAPEHYGCDSRGMWSGEHAFTLADEAAAAISLIDHFKGKVHLAGHSYGGGVALHVALARHERIASLTLYEPSAFYLLPHLGEAGREAHAEISKVARRVCQAVMTGDYCAGMEVFVDYWNGAGAWQAMSRSVQEALVHWAPKAPLDFNALLLEPALPSSYRQLNFPVLLLRGENAPKPTRVITNQLRYFLPQCKLAEIPGAGHMGPFTHAAEVATLFARHIEAAGTAPSSTAYDTASPSQRLVS
jgi:pimeloyl-ACP methyl ester carboxylesterase